jgi:orotidine-5'-phosphate decarboxylase
MHFADRLAAACAAKGAALCVGLDPVFERLPKRVQRQVPPIAIETFCKGVIQAVSPYAAAVKPQLACFERYGSAGWFAYEQVVDAARDAGLLVIADAKRGDIGISATHYAAALQGEGMHGGNHPADAVTINPYLGADAMTPMIEHASACDRGLFALVRTSNPGSSDLQSLMLIDGRSVADATADLVASLGESHVGAGGWSLLGAVVGATHPAEAVRLRGRMPRQWLLMPGVGAQGGTIESLRPLLRDGAGVLVTASRSVIYAFEEGSKDWQAGVAEAAGLLRQELAAL